MWNKEISANIKKWTCHKGNVCFAIPKKRYFVKLWLIIVAVVIAVAICVTEYIGWGSHSLFTPVIVVLLLFFLWWVDIPIRKRDSIISETVHEIMDEVVGRDAKKVGRKVENSIVYHDFKGTYGIVESSFLLVYLDSGEVWEYPLVFHETEKCGAYFECVRSHIVSENQTHINTVTPERTNRILESHVLSEKAKLWLLIVFILFCGGFSFTVFYLIIITVKWWALVVIGGYILLYSATEWLVKMLKSTKAELVRRIVSLPKETAYLFVGSMQPFIAIVGTYFIVGLFTFGIPAIVLTMLNNTGVYTLKPETVAFVVVALGSVLCSTYPVTKYIIQHSILRDRGNHDYEKYREQMALYMVHPSNIVFAVYFVYLLFLDITGFLLIQDDGYLVSSGFDTAILKAFLVYIAYTNMLIKAKAAEIDAQELLQKTVKLFVHDRI